MRRRGRPTRRRNQSEGERGLVGDLDCEEVLDQAAGYVLDIVEPDLRAELEAHLRFCPRCRRQVRAMKASADELLHLKRPFSFRSRLGMPKGMRRGWRVAAALAAAATLAVASTFGAAIGPQSTQSGPSLAGVVTQDGRQVGKAALSGSSRPVLEIALEGVEASGSLVVELVGSTQTVAVGNIDLHSGRGFLLTALRSAPRGLAELRLVDSSGELVAAASLASPPASLNS
jgi:hypothetical protein